MMRNVVYRNVCNIAQERSCNTAQQSDLYTQKDKKTSENMYRYKIFMFSQWEKVILIPGKEGIDSLIASYERRYLLSAKPPSGSFAQGLYAPETPVL